MRKPLFITAILTCAVIVGVYNHYHDSATMSQEAATLASQPPSMGPLPASSREPTLQDLNARQQEPPPPQFPADPPFVGHRSEPARTLTGSTDEALKQIQKYLPDDFRPLDLYLSSGRKSSGGCAAQH